MTQYFDTKIGSQVMADRSREVFVGSLREIVTDEIVLDLLLRAVISR